MASFYSMPIDQVLKTLRTGADGLSEHEARDRLAAKGPNRLDISPPVPAWKILLGQFTNFIIYLLLIAVVFALIIGEYTDSLVILAILVMNSLIGFFQELNANRSLEALRQMAPANATVTRNGRTQVIDAALLTYGDIIQLENGDRIPADARLILARELQLEESALTGESTPVIKQTAELTGRPAIADQSNMVFAATSVVGGRGLAVVTACGMETEIGRISQLVAQANDERTPLQRRLDRFGRNLGLAIVAICALVFCLCLARQWLTHAPVNRFVFLDFAFIAISLAVAAVPTALPAVVTIALSIGTRRLLAKNMLVRRLTSVETLGSCDVICVDKTGTLTTNRMTVTQAWTLETELDLNHDDAAGTTRKYPTLAQLFVIGIACNNSADRHITAAGGNPTELALLAAAHRSDVSWHGLRLNERPFDSGRKCMSVVVLENELRRLYTKGAPDQLLSHCTHVLIDSQVKPLTDEYRQHILDAIHRFSSRAMRVMAFACREADSPDDTREQDLTFVGLQAMIDPPRDDVTESIRRAAGAQIRIIMITGDHRDTAVSIARQIGISGETLTGSQLDNLGDQELGLAMAETNIFARVIPEHKLRIVKALQGKGHVVAMTGDGVNDAPALKKADIGIAIGSGTDVAREAADFILLDDSFTSIVDGVEEGRGIYENIQKSIMLLLSGNLMEVLIILLAVLLGFNLPLTAVLLLWINLVTDGAPALAYSVDPYGDGIMRRPPVPMREGLLPRRRLRLLITLGISGSLIGLVLFHFTGGNSSEDPVIRQARTVVFNYIVLYEMMLVFVIRRSYQARLFTNFWLWAAVIFSILIQAVITYTPANAVFRLSPLAWPELLILLSATALFLVLSLLLGGRLAQRRRDDADETAIACNSER